MAEDLGSGQDFRSGTTGDSNGHDEVTRTKESFSLAKQSYDYSDHRYQHGNMDVHGNDRIPMIRQVIIIEKQPSFGDLVPKLIVIAIYALIIQTFFTIWKKIDKRSYGISVFLILLLSPPLFLLYVYSYFLPVCWLVFLVFISLKTFRALKGVNKNAMRDIYQLFKMLFIISNVGIFLGQAFSFIFFYLKAEYLRFSIVFLLFFLYFGLLSREIIFFLSEVMAANTGFYSKEGVPGRGNNNALCMICAKAFDGGEKIHTLVCTHSFHEDCIKGWCLLGKKSFCPYCRKKVDSSSLPEELWHRTEVWFYPLINSLRSFIVFTLVLTAIILYKIRYQ